MLWTLPTSSCSTAGESSEPYQPTGLLGQFCYAAFTNLLHAFATPPFGRDGDMRDRRLPLGCELQTRWRGQIGIPEHQCQLMLTVQYQTRDGQHLGASSCSVAAVYQVVENPLAHERSVLPRERNSITVEVPRS